MDPSQLDSWHMRRALELAALGLGRVEPNPLVGCVIAQQTAGFVDDRLVRRPDQFHGPGIHGLGALGDVS